MSLATSLFRKADRGERAIGVEGTRRAGGLRPVGLGTWSWRHHGGAADGARDPTLQEFPEEGKFGVGGGDFLPAAFAHLPHSPCVSARCFGAPGLKSVSHTGLVAASRHVVFPRPRRRPARARAASVRARGRGGARRGDTPLRGSAGTWPPLGFPCSREMISYRFHVQVIKFWM